MEEGEGGPRLALKFRAYARRATLEAEAVKAQLALAALLYDELRSADLEARKRGKGRGLGHAVGQRKPKPALLHLSEISR